MVIDSLKRSVLHAACFESKYKNLKEIPKENSSRKSLLEWLLKHFSNEELSNNLMNSKYI